MSSSQPEPNSNTPSPTNPARDSSLWGLDGDQGGDLNRKAGLAESLSLEAGQVPSNLLRWLQGATAVLAGSIMVSALIPIQDYVVASGEIEPAGEIQKVQHLEGGIVREQLVAEGQRVRKGEVLMHLEEGDTGAQEQQTATRITNLTLEQRALRRALGDVPLNSDKDTPTAPSQEVARAFADMQSEKTIEYQRQLALSRQRIATMQAKRREYLDEVAIMKKQTKAYESLDRTGAIPHNDVLEAERRIASTETQLAELDGQIQEAQITLNDLRAKTRMDTYAQLAKVTGEKAELQNQMNRQLGALERLSVRSPVDGIVKSFTVKTPGGVIAAGSIVAEVVPIGQRLEAFTRVNPKDIGNVRVGQKVELKIQAFDYGRFGSISGRVQSVSASTFQDEKNGQPYYKVRVVLDRDYAGKTAGKNQLSPGMTLTADILTERTNLLMYLLGPIRKGFGDALHEQG